MEDSTLFAVALGALIAFPVLYGFLQEINPKFYEQRIREVKAGIAYAYSRGDSRKAQSLTKELGRLTSTYHSRFKHYRH